MAMPFYLTIIERLFTELDLLLNNFVFNGYSALANYLKVPLGLAIVLYIVLMGLSITQGWIQLSMANLVKSVTKIALIYTAAMNWSWFSNDVVDLFNKGAGEIGSVLVAATPVPIPHFAGEGINGAMQSVLIEITQIGSWIWNQGAWNNMSPCFTAALIFGFGYVLILVALFELVLAKIMLAILFSTAPLFISFTLFKPTHGFFDRWLGACVGFALLMIFISSMLALALSLLQWSIAGMYASHALKMSLVGFVPVMIVGFIGVGILLKVAHLAQAIGGGVSTASGSALLAGTVGGAVGSALIGFKMTSSALNATKKLLNGMLPRPFNPAKMNAIRSSLIRPAKMNPVPSTLNKPEVNSE
jgi:type IV secretion system protein VirB6